MATTKSKIQDQTFLFTGTLTEFTRDEAEALVAANGGKVLSGVSAKLNYLVVGADAGSKLAKAKALGTVKILTEKGFLKMVPSGNTSSTKIPVNKVAKKKDPIKKSLAITKGSSKSAVKPVGQQVLKVANPSKHKVVQIGDQVWMVKNLEVVQFRNGDPIPEAKTAKDWKKAGENRKPAWCYYNNDPKNGAKYGILYNWYAVNDPRGLAPEGYHVATEVDWSTLLKHLGSSAGKTMKSKTDWEYNGKGTNSSGFTGLPGGVRFPNGDFANMSINGMWWSTLESDTNKAFYRSLMYSDDDWVNRFEENKAEGMSVRCLKD